MRQIFIILVFITLYGCTKQGEEDNKKQREFEIHKEEIHPNFKSIVYLSNKIGSLENILDLYSKDELLEIIDISIRKSVLYNIKDIEKLQNLEILSMSDNVGLDKINYHKTYKFKKLKLIQFNRNGINKIPKFQSDLLETVHFQRNDIKKLTKLGSYHNVKHFDVSWNKISKIENLDPLKNIRTLNLSRNPITKIENLDDLISMDSLDLSYTKISKLEGLDKLINLESLKVIGNSISKINNINHLSKLKGLNLSNNKISVIENIDKLVNLTFLSLNENEISELPDPSLVNHLNIIELNKNKIKSLSNIGNYECAFDLSENEIESLDGLRNLSKRKMWFYFNAKIPPLRGNPIKVIPRADYEYLKEVSEENKDDEMFDSKWLFKKIETGIVTIID